MENDLANLIILCMFWLMDILLLFMLLSTVTLVVQGRFREAVRYFVSTTVGIILSVSILTLFLMGGNPKKVVYAYVQHASHAVRALISQLPLGEETKKQVGQVSDEGLPEVDKTFDRSRTAAEIQLVKDQIKKNRKLYKWVDGESVYAYSHSQQENLSLGDVLNTPRDLYFMVDDVDNPQPYAICAVMGDKSALEFPYVGITHLYGDYTAEKHGILVNSLIALVDAQFDGEELWVNVEELANSALNSSGYAQLSSSGLKNFFLKKNWAALAKAVNYKVGPLRLSTLEVGPVNPKQITMQVQKTVFNTVKMDSRKRYFLKRLDDDITRFGGAVDVALSAVSLPLVVLNNYNKGWGYATLKDCQAYSILQVVKQAAHEQKDAQIVEACEDAMAVLDSLYGNWMKGMAYSIEQNVPGFLNDAQTFASSAATLITEAYVRSGAITRQYATKINTVLFTVSIELDIFFGALEVNDKIPISECLSDLCNVLVHYANVYKAKYENGEIKFDDLCMMGALANMSFKAGYLSIHILIDRMFVHGILDCLDPYRDINEIWKAVLGDQVGENFETAEKLRSFFKTNAVKFSSMELLDPSLFVYAYNHTWDIDDLAFHLYDPKK